MTRCRRPRALPSVAGHARRCRRPGAVDHVRALFVQTPASLIGYLIGWSLMVAMFWPLAPRGADAGLERRAGACCWLLRLAHYLRFRRKPDADDATLRDWRAQLEACWCWRRAPCGAWRCGCSGAWARPTTAPR